MNVGAFTRHPAGLIGQPFYGWFHYRDGFLQAASAAFYYSKEAVETALATSRKTAGLTALRACLVNEAHHRGCRNVLALNTTFTRLSLDG